MTNLPGPALHLDPKLSDPVQLRNGLILRWEPFHLVANEMGALLLRHWREIGINRENAPLDPDWDRYFGFERIGAFKIATVRDDGRLVGYATWLVLPHIHYSKTLWAHNDVMWMDPAYRFGMTGVRFLRFCLSGLRAAGVKMVHATAMDHFESDRGGLGKVFQFLGFQRIQSVYAMSLEASDEQR